jgi:hypothetical protein
LDQAQAEHAAAAAAANPPVATPTVEGDNTAEKKTRRFKIVLHSSPFLRCVQTSIAISAGLSQAPSPTSNSLHARQPSDTNLTSPSTLAESQIVSPGVNGNEPPARQIEKTVLRLDAFLGEWLSPEYFEMITPPPGSSLMIASAKADLLRREDYSINPHFNTHVHSNSSGQLWSRPNPLSSPSTGEARNEPTTPDPLVSVMHSIATPLPSREATSSTDSMAKVRFTLPPAEETFGYVSPVPNYAISLSAKIPEGYVAHARDACVAVDYQWDSMREPLNWGDGGEYGEEWTSMHRRFRKGVQHLVDWYGVTDDAADLVTKIVRPAAQGESECAIEDDPVDDESESVVIIVSHGAGCNALIGAITHQPALMDVGIASLTMAIRKPGKDGPARVSTEQATGQEESTFHSSIKGVLPVHQYYDLKIFANTEHLRSSSTTPIVSRHPSSSNILGGAARGRVGSLSSFGQIMSSFTYTDSIPGSRSSSANASLGSMRRSSTTNSVPRAPGIYTSGLVDVSTKNSYTPSGLSSSPSIGLWSPLATETREEGEDEEDDDLLPDFDHTRKFAPKRKSGNEVPANLTLTEPVEDYPVPRVTTPVRDGLGQDADEVDDLPQFSPQLGLGIGGLWGNPRPPGEAERSRDMTSTKRRWTVNERA